MKKSVKLALGLTVAGAAAAGAAYGTCSLIDELLFNRNMVVPEKIGRKISGCDDSHLGEFLQNNLKWLEDYGYEKHYIISDSGYKLTKGDKTFEIAGAGTNAKINGANATLPAAAKVDGFQIFVPASAVAQCFGYEYSYDAAANTAYIKSITAEGGAN